MSKKKSILYLIISLIIVVVIPLFYINNVSRYTKKSQFIWILILSVFVLLLSILYLIFNKKIENKKTINSLIDWLSFIPTVINIILIMFSFFILISTVKGKSMVPTLNDGDKVIVNHFNYKEKKDDVVVVKMRKKDYINILDEQYLESLFYNEDEYYIVKRLKGLPGDKIKLVPVTKDSGKLNIYINDELVIFNDSAYEMYYYYKLAEQVKINNEYILKEDEYIVLGDNLLNSTDSRQTGLIKRNSIMGKVVLKDEKSN